MENLSLEKFVDAKLESAQMEFVHAGDSCTGGGSGRQWHSETTYTDYSYESDCVLANGRIEYYGFKNRVGFKDA